MPTKFPSGRGQGIASGRGAPFMPVNGVTRLEVVPQGVGKWTGKSGAQFNSLRDKFRGYFTLSGITRNATGTPLGSCVVHLIRTDSDTIQAITTSDGSGNFSFTVANNSGTYYIVAYLTGSPDVAGTTKNNLIAL